MSGSERPFDDDRWPDQEGFAHCFLCGRKVDPLDPHRGTFTANVSACEPLPIHLPCLNGRDMLMVEFEFKRAINQLGAATIRHQREAAKVSIVDPRAH